MDKESPESIIREVVDYCADCDVCRYLMDDNCLFFPQLYRLWDQEIETGEKITDQDLRQLVDLCNFCALCPCPNIRSNVVRAKTRYIDRDGLKFGVRTLEDVELLGKICGALPRLSNLFLGNKAAGGLLKKAIGIHQDRKFPKFPVDKFQNWAESRKLHVKKTTNKKRKAAFFVGCTGRYLFPEVPRAAVEVLLKNDVEVYIPPQKCCGMPTLLEGDRNLTLIFAGYNLESLAGAVEDGYDIVCSCPTCGFMLKQVLKEGAYYSEEYQEFLGADADYIKAPDYKGAMSSGKFIKLSKTMYRNILKDDGYFSSLSSRARILTAEHTYDLGEYLLALSQAGEFRAPAGRIQGRLVYYPPCHAREQDIGRPYSELLASISTLDSESINGSFYCCGMAGIMGFKKEFHESSLKLGQNLMDKIREVNPDGIVTECLSCRLQFSQQTPLTIRHPIELIYEAYNED